MLQIPYVLVLQLALTGQIIALDGGFRNEEECRAALTRLQSGEKMTVYVQGVAVPVERGIGCTPKAVPGVSS